MGPREVSLSSQSLHSGDRDGEDGGDNGLLQSCEIGGVGLGRGREDVRRFGGLEGGGKRLSGDDSAGATKCRC